MVDKLTDLRNPDGHPMTVERIGCYDSTAGSESMIFYKQKRFWGGIAASIVMRDSDSLTDNSFYLGGNSNPDDGKEELFLTI